MLKTFLIKLTKLLTKESILIRRMIEMFYYYIHFIFVP